MDEKMEQTCPNCKKDIPSVNFTIHMVHCARNICVCPVCKEAVPRADLDVHREALHVPMPCKQCGEKVCGSDMEDHLRDSCEKTVRSCRFCELELPRRELPPHEAYCGVRTEQCADCQEWVMLKYRQLHLDSNHGFLRLDDDPVPVPKKDPPKANIPKINNTPKPSNIPTTSASSSNGVQPSTFKTNHPNEYRPRTEIRYFNGPNAGLSRSEGYGVNGVANFKNSRIETNYHSGNTSGSSGSDSVDAGPSRSEGNGVANLKNSIIESNYNGGNTSGSSGSDCVNGDGASGSGARPKSAQNVFNNVAKTVKRTNDQPQVNMAVAASNKVSKELPSSRGAVKKRPAPQPPAQPPRPDPRRDQAYLSALQRQQEEERKRQEQNAYNLARGLPPVLTPAAKLEKLRKMDALHNRETADADYKSRLQGRVWTPPDVPVGYVLGSNENANHAQNLETERRKNQSRSKRQSKPTRSDFEDLQPMSPQEFMERFNELRLRKETEDQQRTSDRFSEIKSSLRELRRGLNEVTAPYNSTNTNETHSNRNSERRHRRRSPRTPRDSNEDGPVRLPCEFCATLVFAEDLVQHQTGCRPDLAQLRSPSPRARRSPERAAAPLPTLAPLPHPDPYEEPVIPCEFCTESLPVYLITEHQERCRREANELYRD